MSSVLLAQVTLSLDLGYSNKGYSYASKGLNAFNGSLPKGQECYLAPRISFALTDGVSLGIQLGAGYSSYDYAEGFYAPTTSGWRQSAAVNQTMLTTSAGAYLRLRCASIDNLSMHIEIAGSYGLGWGWDQRTEYRASDGSDVDMKRRHTEQSLCIQVVPVATYAFSDHVGMDVHLNLAALSFVSTTISQWPYGIKGWPVADAPESKTVEQEFSIGVNALNTSLLTIGFGYTF